MIAQYTRVARILVPLTNELTRVCVAALCTMGCSLGSGVAMMFLGRRRDTMAQTPVCRRCQYAAWTICIGCAFSGSSAHALGLRSQDPHGQSVSMRSVRLGKKHSAKTPQTDAPRGKQLSMLPTSEPSKPAIVVFKNGNLTIEANNSDLKQILGNIADISGMKINGIVESTAVYGVYGPQNPGNVLTDLLADLGYNVLMVGRTQDGAPRELVLTRRNGAASLPGTSRVPAAESPMDSELHARDPYLPGPGAIVNVPPAPPENIEERVQKTLQRLTRMHESQQNQTAPK